MDFSRKKENLATNIGDGRNDNTGNDQNLDHTLVMELNVNGTTTSDTGLFFLYTYLIK